MTPDDLKLLRADMELTQTDLAAEIGLKLRAYQDLEAGKSPIRKMHVLALERVALAYGAKGKLADGSFMELLSYPWFEKLKQDAAAFSDQLT